MRDGVEFDLLNGFQRDFPLVPRPFADIAARLGLGEDEVLERYRALAAGGELSRIGTVFRPNTVGASVLAALAVAPARLEEVAAFVSAQPEVNHNYEREHAWNLWFVAAAGDEAGLERVLERIAAGTGLPVLRLPLLEEFHIDLGFDLATGQSPHAARPVPPAPAALGMHERALVEALADGLPLVAEPFAALGRQAGLEEDDVLALLERWLADGVVRRIGTVLRHRELGYAANAMTVWDVPDAQVRAAGRRLAEQPGVSLCYLRPRRPPEWPYNLFCMVHRKERSAALEAIEDAARAAGLQGYRREILFSRRCFLQRGARYVRQAA